MYVSPSLERDSIGWAKKAPPETPRIIALQAVGRPSGMDEASGTEASLLAEAGAVMAGVGPLVIRARSAGSYTAMMTRCHYGLPASGVTHDR